MPDVRQTPLMTPRGSMHLRNECEHSCQTTSLDSVTLKRETVEVITVITLLSSYVVCLYYVVRTFAVEPLWTISECVGDLERIPSCLYIYIYHFPSSLLYIYIYIMSIYIYVSWLAVPLLMDTISFAPAGRGGVRSGTDRPPWNV